MFLNLTSNAFFSLLNDNGISTYNRGSTFLNFIIMIIND